jgi:hypothetical protein
MGKILEDPLTSSFFQEFLKREYADESFEFHTIVERFKRERDDDKRKRLAHTIYQNFINPDSAEREIFLSVAVKEAILEHLERPECDEGMYNAAQREILHALRCDNFGRFCQSFFYEFMAKQIENRDFVIDPVVSATFLEFCANENEEAWEKRGEEAAGGMEIWNWRKSLSSRESLVVKARIRMKVPAAKVFDVVSFPELHKEKYDLQAKSELLQSYGPYFKVILTILKDSGYGRYGITGHLNEKLSDGKFISIYRSIKFPEKLMTKEQIEITKTLKENFVSMSGFYIEEDPQDKNQCLVTKLCKMDLGDAVAPQLMKKLTNNRTEMLRKLKMYMQAL